MTGATSAWRGKESFGAFAAGKHGLRALSQSIAREFGPRGVHVAFVVGPVLLVPVQIARLNANGAVSLVGR